MALAILASSSVLFLSAQAPQQVGTWAPSGAIADGRSGAAAVALRDGTTLIVGGVVSGAASDTVLRYDPATGGLVTAGQLLSARAGHTATLLEDGRVLVAGGRAGDTAATDIEVFDPDAGTSTVLGQLAQARVGHASARVDGGIVVLFGGATAEGAVLDTVERIDVATGSVTAGANRMLSARVNASATTLIDGRVLVAGGNDGSTDLASAEFYFPLSQGFEPVANGLSVPRSSHAAVLLPHNGGVLIAGGSSNGVAQTAVDLLVPAESPDPYSFGVNAFVATAPMAGARAGATAGPGREGYAWVDGGGSADPESYRFATIKTDKDDYAPGERAVITGTGWMPGEDVRLLFQEYPAVHEDYVLTVTADEAGNISWDRWAPESHDVGVRFYLLASDSRSRAQTTFTDGNLFSTLTLQVTPTSVTPGGPLSWSVAALCDDRGANTCASEGYSNSGAVQNGYTVEIQRATTSDFSGTIFTEATVSTVSGSASGTVAAPSTGGPYYYRALHEAQTLANIPVMGDSTNVWRRAESNTVTVTLLSDTTAPTTTLTVGTPKFGTNDRFVTGATEFSLSCADNAGGSGCAATFYQIVSSAASCPSNTNEAQWTAYSTPFTLPAPDGEVRVCFFSKDTNGNRETPKSQNHFRDTVAPSTTAAATANAAAYTSDTWTRFDVSVNLSAADGDGEAGVKEITYAATGATTIASTTVAGASVTGLVVSAEGTTTLTFSAKDNVGNTESTKTLVIKIDKTAPSITDLGPTTTPNGAGWYNTDVTNRFKAADALSGLDAACLAAFPDVSGERIQSKTTSTEGAAVTVASDSCTDAAGNSATAVTSTAFKIDKTAPVIVQLDFSPAANGAGWHNTDVTVRFKVTDGVSGVDAACSIAFPLVGTEHLQSVTTSGQGTAITVTSASCTDLAGNAAGAVTSSAFKIDKVAPTIEDLGPTTSPNANGWYNTDVVNRFKATDGLSGLTGTCAAFVVDGADRIQSKASTGEGMVIVVTSDSCTDVAGNTVPGVASAAFKIDKTAPVILNLGPTTTPNAAGWYNTDVTNRFQVTEVLSGPDAACQAAFPLVGSDRIQSKTTVGEGNAVTVTSNGCADLAGNSAAGISSAAFKIDKTAPLVAITSPSSGNTIVLTIAVNGTASDGLSGIKSVTLNGSPAVYNAAAGTWATSSNVTLACGANTLTATATDNADLTTNSASVTLTRLCFTFEYLRPLEQSYTGGPTVVNDGKYGRVIPVKGIIRRNGVAQGDADLAALGLTLRIGVIVVGCGGVAVADAVEEYADAGLSSGGTNIFRWTLDGFWIYNLDTKTPPGVPMTINNCYRLDAYVSDTATPANKVKITESPYAIFKPVK